MLIRDYAIVQIERDERRCWHILGQVNDLPGGCRAGELYPILSRLPDGTTVRVRAQGYIDPQERYGYIYMRFHKREGLEVMVITDAPRVE